MKTFSIHSLVDFQSEDVSNEQFWEGTSAGSVKGRRFDAKLLCQGKNMPICSDIISTLVLI